MTSNGYQNNTCPGDSCQYPDHKYPTVAWTDPYQPANMSILFEDDVCPHLKGSPGICCNTSQILTLRENFVKIRTTFSKCPACATSFMRMFCDFTCSPEQHEFVEIQAFRPPPIEKYAFQARFVQTQKFQDELWSTCKRNIIGTEYVYKKFDSVRDFLPGIVGMEYSNPAVVFKFLDEDEKYEIPGYIGETIPCKDKCTCQYCEETCDSPNSGPLSPDFSCQIGALHCWTLFTIVVFIVAILTLCAITFVGCNSIWQRFRRTSLKDRNDYDSSTINSTDAPSYSVDEKRSLLSM